MPIFRRLGAFARYSRLCIPVETGTPPRRRKVHSVQHTRQSRASIPSCPCASAPEWARLRWEPFRKLRVCKIQPLRVIIPFPAQGNPHRRSPQSPPSSAGPPWAYPSARCARTRWHRPPPRPRSPCRRRRTGRPDEGPPPP